MYKKILVATDGSKIAEKGIIAGAKLAKGLNAELFIVTVTSAIPSYTIDIQPEYAGTASAFEDTNADIAKEAKNILEQGCAIAKQYYDNVKAIHAENPIAAQGIIDSANEYGAEIIIIASHGRTGLTRMLLGSQAQEILNLSQLPVLVVK
ncbi:universal stress protein [Bartonella sp. TP]|uniref:universal stress protein n=1 Tax=Bartonella sp. TP TaxID=3057550 RepID=UPI0025AEEDF7|nr:universal stress protein [Bartonella sp. TP]MDN5248512.1 universal stress protein [Alphaproteobacteria bacterium]WJW79563.1 universal stress protein [Bartonella sp. TP]